jgi:hypothetical protein
LLWKIWQSVTFAYQCTKELKEKQLKHSECLSAGIAANSIKMWMTWKEINTMNIHEHFTTWGMLHIQWLIRWLIMMMTASAKKWQVKACTSMSCYLQTGILELCCWPAELWNSVNCQLVDSWPKVGTINTAHY